MSNGFVTSIVRSFGLGLLDDAPCSGATPCGIMSAANAGTSREHVRAFTWSCARRAAERRAIVAEAETAAVDRGRRRVSAHARRATTRHARPGHAGRASRSTDATPVSSRTWSAGTSLGDSPLRRGRRFFRNGAVGAERVPYPPPRRGEALGRESTRSWGVDVVSTAKRSSWSRPCGSSRCRRPCGCG